jgi:hypothetical protein
MPAVLDRFFKKASLKPEDDAPLPPDFLSQKKSAPKADDAPLPPVVRKSGGRGTSSAFGAGFF